MVLMVGIWIALSAAIGALVWAKVTRLIELFFLGAWGIITGAMLAGVKAFSDLSFTALWGAIFG